MKIKIKNYKCNKQKFAIGDRVTEDCIIGPATKLIITTIIFPDNTVILNTKISDPYELDFINFGITKILDYVVWPNETHYVFERNYYKFFSSESLLRVYKL